jgi:hypothetical protein
MRGAEEENPRNTAAGATQFQLRDSSRLHTYKKWNDCLLPFPERDLIIPAERFPQRNNRIAVDCDPEHERRKCRLNMGRSDNVEGRIDACFQAFAILRGVLNILTNPFRSPHVAPLYAAWTPRRERPYRGGPGDRESSFLRGRRVLQLPRFS